MMTNTTTRTREQAATMIGLVAASFVLVVSFNVGRTFTARQLNERYSAEDVIGESSRCKDALEGLGTSGQGLAFFKHDIFGAGDASVHGLNQSLVTRPNANPKLNLNCENLNARK